MTSKLGSGVHLNPEQAKLLPPEVHTQFLHAFSHALHGVFLFGAAMAALPFLLSWLLKEVPLRTTVGRGPAQAEVEEAVVGASPDERLVETGASPRHVS